MNKKAKTKDIVVLTLMLVLLLAIFAGVVHEQSCHGENCQVCTFAQNNVIWLIALICDVFLLVNLSFKFFNLKNTLKFEVSFSLVCLKTKLTD